MSNEAKALKFDVNRIYNKPNLSGVSIGNIGWSPDGKTLSYVLGTDDSNEVWGFDVANQERKLLFDFARLQGTSNASQPHIRAKKDGVPIRDWHRRRVRASGGLNYHWTPGGEHLLITAMGGAPQLLELKTGRLSSITHEKIPIRNTRVAPNGRFVAFVRGFDLYMVDLQTQREIPLTSGGNEYMRNATPDTMGDLLYDSGFWWSPDSSQIAYLQTLEKDVPIFWYANLLSERGENVAERFPQPGDPIPVIGLKVVSKRGHVFIDTRAWPGWYLSRVMWLPDSRHLAIQMLSRDQKELQLILADSFTGMTKTILTETDSCWINVVDDLRFFSDSRRFLWSSERDSFRHLYIYDVSGKELLQLTSGDEACVAVDALDEANKAVYYLVWPGDHTEGHLKRVSFSDKSGEYSAKNSELLTQKPGTHFAHISPDCSLFADLHCTQIQPPHLDLYRNDGSFVTTVEENSCEQLAVANLREFQFKALPAAQLGLASDDMPLYSKLLEPSNIEEGQKYPVIVYIYGGPLPGGFGLARNAINYWRPVPELWLQMMAQNGYGIFSLDNRGSNAAPRGHDWEKPIHRQLGHVELADQLEGVKYLKSLDWVDPDRIGIIGGSFGGFMTLNAMLRAAGTYKAAVAYAPVTDWRHYDVVYAERYMDTPDDNLSGYDETALPQYAGNLQSYESIKIADDWDHKLLLIHGASDPNVHIQHSVRLVDQMIQTSRRFRMMFYPGQVHMSFFGMGQSPARLWWRITDFFTDNL